MLKRIILLCLLLSGALLGNTVWIHAKAQVAQLLIRQAWKSAQELHENTVPWPWADFWPVARMIVEKDHSELFVLNTASGEALAFGPGQVGSWVLPGWRRPVVIAGHRDTHFSFLRGARQGDRIVMEDIDGSVHVYEYFDQEVVDVRHTQLRLGDIHKLKLVTCYPFDAVLPGGPLRLLVRFVERASKEFEVNG